MTLLVNMSHAREAKERYGGFCARGIVAWLERHEMNARQFIREGYPVEVFDQINDALGNKVAAIARERAAKG